MEDKLLLPKLRRLQQQPLAEIIPTSEKPLTMKNPLPRLFLTLQLHEMQYIQPEEISAHAAASEFPGTVLADAKKVKQKIKIDTSVPGWHSTGLYAVAGELITVVVPQVR